MNSAHSLSHVWLFVTPWTAACQATLFITNSWRCSNSCPLSWWFYPLSHPLFLLLLPSIFPSIRVFSKESVLRIRWPKCWSFSFSISPSNEYSGLISFRIDWFDLLAIQETPRVFSNTIREMQVKTMRYHHTPIRIAKIQNTGDIKLCQGSLLIGMQNCTATLEDSLVVSYKTKHTLTTCICIQSCPTLCNLMDCSPPGSSVHWDFSGKNIGMGCHFLLKGIFPTQGSNPHLLHWQMDSFNTAPPWKPQFLPQDTAIALFSIYPNELKT